MFSRHALPLLCEAFHNNLTLPRYLFLTIGWYTRFWWRDNEGVNCTVEELESVLRNTIAVSDEVFLDPVADVNLTTSLGLTVGEFLKKEQEFVKQPPLNFNTSQYSSYCHDAAWTLAFALNNTLNSLEDSTVNEDIAQAFNITPPFRLEDFTYENSQIVEMIFNHLHNTSFNGVTGPISFDENGIRNLTNIIIFQYRNVNETYFERVRIGNVFEDSNGIVYSEGENETTVFNGLVPYDGIALKAYVTVHPALTSIYIILACVGIAFAVACLIFTFVCRNTKLIKLASKKLNFLIGIGAIVLYVDTVFFVIPTTNRDVVAVFCHLTPWLTAIGYSLCYGTILVKMARVYYIFNNPSPKKKTVKDMYLMLGVAFLVAIDLTILTGHIITEGVKGNLVAQERTNVENPKEVEGVLEIVTDNCIFICDSTARDIFLGILYGYKMALQIVALLLAFSIRKVKVKGLDDSKYIAAAIYVTSIVLAVIIVATYSLKEVINGFAALFCTGFLVGTTVILILVFVPLMVSLYKDPKGEDIFKKSSAISESMGIFKKSSAISESMGIARDNTIKTSNHENEIRLRKKIKNLEDEVKEKDDIISLLRRQTMVEASPDKTSHKFKVEVQIDASSEEQSEWNNDNGDNRQGSTTLENGIELSTQL